MVNAIRQIRERQMALHSRQRDMDAAGILTQAQADKIRAEMIALESRARAAIAKAEGRE